MWCIGMHNTHIHMFHIHVVHCVAVNPGFHGGDPYQPSMDIEMGDSGLRNRQDHSGHPASNYENTELGMGRTWATQNDRGAAELIKDLPSHRLGRRPHGCCKTFPRPQ